MTLILNDLASASKQFTAFQQDAARKKFWTQSEIFVNRHRTRLTVAFLIAASMAAPAGAEALQPGFWKVTSTPEVNGAPAAPQEKMRCMTPAETSDLDKTFSPEARTINSACERVEHELTPNSLKWRLQCTGQMNIDVAGAFSFETPQRYIAEIRTKMSMPGQTVNSGVKIVGERVGECP
jgi:hypothetical protein